MADHFGAIGIGASDRAAFEQLIGAILQESTEELRSEQYRHLRWTDPSGASMYAHLDADSGGIDCITPFFVPTEGLARWRVQTSAPCDDAGCAHCGGADCDILDEAGEVITRTAVQWALYQPFREWLGRERSFELEVVIFAHNIEVFPDEDAFSSSPASIMGDSEDGEPLQLAPNAFMPWGMFGEGGDMSERAIARLNGRIVAAQRRENRLTGQPFWQLRIESLPGRVDVVAAAAWIEDEPKVGGHLTVDGWLVGRPVGAPEPEATTG